MKNFIRLTALVLAAAMVALFCATPAGAQTRQELKLFKKIMRTRNTRPDYSYVMKDKTKEQLAGLNHEELLFQIASTHSEWLIAEAAANKIGNQELLVRLATTPLPAPAPVSAMVAAMKRITDRETFMQILLERPGLFLSSLFNTLSLEEVMRVSKEVDLSQIRNLHHIDVTNLEILDYILFEERFSDYHSSVVSGLKDRSLLKKVVKEYPAAHIRRQAFKQLDAVSINGLYSSAGEYEPLRIAISIQTGRSNWDTEVERAQDIGDVIEAMTLVPENGKPTVESITNACHRYIRKGDETKIPDLEFLLNTYGDRRLAEDYLNSGNQRLRSIAAAWARSKGYNIGAGDGSHRAGWGSQR